MGLRSPDDNHLGYTQLCLLAFKAIETINEVISTPSYFAKQYLLLMKNRPCKKYHTPSIQYQRMHIVY